ncbi:hypothetical protein [Streptococcus pneumoniae]|uniref:hypothetical protein n=1 Tax=Streptococcus pneumoniae TaxID=1313 RepID=UPI00214DAEBB|nr:hypothetical protein [Streptococcus pneumoniae]
MKIKAQTRKLATGCSKYRFEVADGFEVEMKLTKSAAEWFEEIFEEYYMRKILYSTNPLRKNAYYQVLKTC